MKNAFTLIELAIVLVIIGLLVAGVLAGQDLIKQAHIRKNINELQNINRSWITFKLKYNNVPGDLKNPTMFFPVCDGTRLSLSNNLVGDENGRVDITESNCVWLQLGSSGLYLTTPGDMYADHDSSNDPDFNIGEASYMSEFPVENSFVAWIFYMDFLSGQKNGNYYYLYNIYMGNGITPNDLYSIDKKMDDGKPATGLIIGHYQGPLSTCVDNVHPLDSGMGTTTSDYNISLDEPVCELLYRME